MATWKKILTEDDGLNLGSANQSIAPNTNRTVLLGYPSTNFATSLLTVGGDVGGNGTLKSILQASIQRISASADTSTVSLTGNVNIAPGAHRGYTGNQSVIRFLEYTTSENNAANYIELRGSPSTMTVNYALDLPAAEPGAAGKVAYISAYDTTSNVATLAWQDMPILSWSNAGDNRILFGGGSAGAVDSDEDLRYETTDSIKTLLLDDSIIVCKSTAEEPAGLVLDGANLHGDSQLDAVVDASAGIYVTFDHTASSKTQNNVLTLDSNGEIVQAQANSLGTSNGFMGLYLEDTEGSTDTTARVLTYGVANLDPAMVNGTFVAGQPIFLDPSNAGEVTFTRPSTSGEVVRILGYGIKSSVTLTQVMFMPSTDYILLA